MFSKDQYFLSPRKTLAWSISNSDNHMKKKRTKFLTRCRKPEFCERYKIYFELFDAINKGILPRTVKEGKTCLYIQ